MNNMKNRLTLLGYKSSQINRIAVKATRYQGLQTWPIGLNERMNHQPSSFIKFKECSSIKEFRSSSSDIRPALKGRIELLFSFHWDRMESIGPYSATYHLNV